MRGLSAQFLRAMRRGLNNGRAKGYVGWDRNWRRSNLPCDSNKWFISRLHEEVDELILALHDNDPDEIMSEAADVANFAMFIADINKN